jgi:hypothetical protein
MFTSYDYFHPQNLINNKNTITTITMAAILAYDDRKFKYVVSFLYFCEIDDKLLAFESNAENRTKN